MEKRIIQVEEKVPAKLLVPLSIQHMFAMFGASVLVPFMFGINPAIVLLMNGVGTLLFIFITKGKAPAYLGSSFAFLSPGILVMTKFGYQYALGGFVVLGIAGMILALNMPPQIPVWVPALGGIFAIIVVKQLYGGLGQNFMNPALAARCFLLISFAGMMNNFSAASLGFDSVSGATPLAAMRAGQSVDLASMFIGRIPGTIGEVSTIALLIGGIYLLVRKVISWRIPVIYIGTVAVFVFIFGGFDVNYVLCQVCGGGLIFGAFFMATDYVTSPITPMGQIVFGVVLGLLTGIFRLWGASPEGVSYAIILSNLFVPMIERVTLPKAFGKEAKKA